jgi:hypothetical protein
MHKNGFGDAAVTQGGADGGIDVRSAKGIGQVKLWKSKVGVDEVQRLYGLAVAERKAALFFAAAGYTGAAAKWADAHGVARFSVAPVQPLNSHARKPRPVGKR